MKAYLHLEDGSIFEGESIGFAGETTGEVVFSTGMTGYVQSLTDPSFAGQILVFTYPLIGNYGVPKRQWQAPGLCANFESDQIWVQGVVVTEACTAPSHYQSHQSFSAWLASERISGIAGIDTRALTQKLRDGGVQRGMIRLTKKSPQWVTPVPVSLGQWVSCKHPTLYKPQKANGKHVVLVDCGVKHGIVRSLLGYGYRVTRIPYDASPLAVKHIDGVVGSNGPGDPKDWPVTVNNIRRALAAGVPYLGICLGHQLLALAIGADTYKLPYGHRGINQPCLDLVTNKAYLTSQNHGYAVNKDTIPAEFSEWFTNLNDGTNEGLHDKTKKIASVQFHPEGNPGPFDTEWILNTL